MLTRSLVLRRLVLRGILFGLTGRFRFRRLRDSLRFRFSFRFLGEGWAGQEGQGY